MTINVFFADRRGRGWETRWTRKKDKVTLHSEPADETWQRFPEPVRKGVLEFHKTIATARAKAEHTAAKNGMLFEPKQDRTVRAMQWRGDEDSLNHLIKDLLGIDDMDPSNGQTRRTFAATTKTRLSYTRTNTGTVTVALTRSLGRGTVGVQPGAWLFVNDLDELDTVDEDTFHSTYQKVTS